MGTYHEIRAPSGAPADGERDVWLSEGKVKWGKWVAASSAWAIEREEDYQGQVGMQGPQGEEGPPCPTGGEADTLDGHHASDFLMGGGGTWHQVGAAYEPAFETGYSAGTLGLYFKKINGIVFVQGDCNYTSGSGNIFTLPADYRPSQNLVGAGSVYCTAGLDSGSGWIKIFTTGGVKYYGMGFTGTVYRTLSAAFPV